jgi:hypothetical protein
MMAFKVERPDDLTEREAWSWAEAEFCQRMADHAKDNITGWIARPGEHSSKYQGALHAALSAECWEQMAWHFRKPYYGRKEAESYRALATPSGKGE